MEWISTKERMPDTEREVMAVLKTKKGRTLRHLCFMTCTGPYPSQWVGAGYAYSEDAVTHWMDFPDLPEDEEG